MTNANETRTAIITGAARGIGVALAKRLAQDGFAVVINYANSATSADALVEELTASGHQAMAIKADITNADAVKQMFDHAETRFGGVDVIVNNAGIMTTQPISEMSDAVYDAMMDTNVRGTFNMLREGAKRLRNDGRVINFSTTALHLKLPGYAVYNATKAAVEAMTGVYAKELRGRNITVNAVAPGPVATELFLNGKTDEQIAQFSKMPPIERLGQPEDISGVVSFLAGPDSGWVNGQTLRANGGLA
ncbi:3-ketoacyl-ACP reductase [Thalassospira lucentensis]|mgnify:FL=1|uniref:3-ketoacyl-ACP reductase n=1 Tax=Thalassospira lucentensis TaxID=168935 RepID=A0A154L7N6_9PROT|nr:MULTISPECIES: SDR family oxidoreductase [Thalassospira]KZB66727.1 3-ketoacyl-ACP reductase [Thalassospira lucentensis]MAZ33156.1 3-ketoacyl-ACP reductase [Thalassospira sp.]MCH2273359.1 SDR family oxidoreductase [Thalassospira sp.]|tara:strand:- start:656 stop:1399 length:744 start_codon:yes stop_codon:yes gene_type:complete